LTVTDTVVVFVKLPETPVMVMETVPVAAVLPAANVKVLVLVVPLGLNEAVTPLGKPEADKLTLPLNPFCGVTEIVLVPLAPCVMVKLFGEAEIEKFGAGGAGIVMDTPSNVAVANAEELRLVAASPIYTLGAIVIVWLVPNCVHFTPSGEPYMLNTFPLRESLTQVGSVVLPRDW